MRHRCLVFLLTITVVAILGYPLLAAYGGKDEIFFISSGEELSAALKNKNTARGFGVSTVFYESANNDTQESIDRLISDSFARKLAVFLYGQPFNRELAKKLLVVAGNEPYDGSNCTPTAFAGIFPTKDDVMTLCGADDPREESYMRQWILLVWNRAKELAEEDKYSNRKTNL